MEITEIPALGAVDSHVEGTLVVDGKEVVAIGRTLSSLLDQLAVSTHQFNVNCLVRQLGLTTAPWSLRSQINRPIVM
jgi:hypothetical protein